MMRTSPNHFYRTIMLRRKLSAGLLKATSSGASPMQQQSAGLVSAVLLNSQRNWKGETLVTLKSELKRRGLSQTGNKAALVARLSSADVSGHLPPVPAMPSSSTSTLRAAKSMPAMRQISTSSALAFPPKSKTASPTKPEGANQAPVADPVDAPVVTSTGPAVISQKTEAAKPEPVEPEMITVAPGLPETKASEGDRKSLDVHMPGPRLEEAPEQVIPLTPDNFRSNDKLPKEEDHSTEDDLPKLVTTAGSSTHPAGGPSHALHESTDPHEMENKETQDAAEELFAAASSKLPSLGKALSSMASAPARAIRENNIAKSVMPEIGPAKGFHNPKKNDKYEASSEPLEGSEKTGAYVLAGILGFGLFGALWPGSGKKSKHDDKHGEKGEKGGKQGSGKGGVPLGDEQWQKASGAEVVGHGHRKV